MSNEVVKVPWRDQTVVGRVWYLPALVLFPLAVWGRDPYFPYFPEVSENFFLRIGIGIVMLLVTWAC